MLRRRGGAQSCSPGGWGAQDNLKQAGARVPPPVAAHSLRLRCAVTPVCPVRVLRRQRQGSLRNVASRERHCAQGWRRREVWEARGADFDASSGGARRRFEIGGMSMLNIENEILHYLKSAIGVVTVMVSRHGMQ